MKVFRVYLHEFNAEGNRNFYNLESDAESVAELKEWLDEDGVIVGDHLFTKRDRTTRKTNIITRRREVMLGSGAIFSVALSTWRFVEQETVD